jgi:hypothetical protein
MQSAVLLHSIRATLDTWFRKRKEGKRALVMKHLCRFDHLEDRTVPASVFTFATMGDSLTAPYSEPAPPLGDHSWVELLLKADPGQISIRNFASKGATSTSLLSSGQPGKVANLVRMGVLHYSVIEVGGNDELQFMTSITGGNPNPFVNTVVSNIEKAVEKVAAAGVVHQVIGLLPDIGRSPYVRNSLGGDPIKLGRLTAAVQMANDQLIAYAAAHQMPAAQIEKLDDLTAAPIQLAGMSTSDFWDKDLFHPSSVIQGLTANVILESFHVAYGVNVGNLRLSDQEIMYLSGNAPVSILQQPAVFYDITPFVVYTPAMPGAPLLETAVPALFTDVPYETQIPSVASEPIANTIYPTMFSPTARTSSENSGFVWFEGSMDLGTDFLLNLAA